MAKTDVERQKAHREKMYAAGYKQKIIWVPNESEKKTSKLEKKVFMRRLDALTLGWSKTKLNKLFREILKFIKEKNKEEVNKEND